MQDALVWVVTYRDGSQIHEIDAAGDHGWADVDQSQAVLLCLMDAVTGAAVVAVAIPDGKAPYFVRERTMTIDPSGIQVGSTSTVTILGYDGAILHIYPDGSIALAETRH